MTDNNNQIERILKHANLTDTELKRLVAQVKGTTEFRLYHYTKCAHCSAKLSLGEQQTGFGVCSKCPDDFVKKAHANQEYTGLPDELEEIGRNLVLRSDHMNEEDIEEINGYYIENLSLWKCGVDLKKGSLTEAFFVDVASPHLIVYKYDDVVTLREPL